jgi:DNA-binding NtrC family response regulator
VVLEQGGFHVLTAENGRDAMRASAAHPGEIDVLVSDVMMPGMDGRALAERLLEEYPNLPVLFVTGTCDRVELHECERFPFIEKPFAPSHLLSTVRKILATHTRHRRNRLAGLSFAHQAGPDRIRKH